MDSRTWLVRVDHESPVHDIEESVLAAIGNESEIGEAAKRHNVAQSMFLRLTGRLRKHGILKVENRDYPYTAS